MDKSKLRRQFYINKAIDEKIEQLEAFDNATPGQQMIGVKTRSELIEEAIDLLYSKRFGQEIMFDSIGVLEVAVVNAVKTTLDSRIHLLFEAFNIQNKLLQENVVTSDFVKECVVSVLRSVTSVTSSDPETIKGMIMKNDGVATIVEQALLEKQKLNE